jgi:hypothetical protein
VLTGRDVIIHERARLSCRIAVNQFTTKMEPIMLSINEACQALRIGRTALHPAMKSGDLIARRRRTTRRGT